MSTYTVEWEIYLKSGQTVHVTTSHYMKIQGDIPHVELETELENSICGQCLSFSLEDSKGDKVFLLSNQVSGFKNKVVDYPEEDSAE